MSASMLDLSFDVAGGELPFHYQAALRQALLQIAPALADERVGLLPLRVSNAAHGYLLSRRIKLVLRVPEALLAAAGQLSGCRLAVGSGWIQLGICKARSIEPYPTLHAPVVASDEDEVNFMQRVQAELDKLQIVGKLICGRYSREAGMTGYSLVVHDLKPDASVKLQAHGLGGQRLLGCGVFVHYKLISGLE